MNGSGFFELFFFYCVDSKFPDFQVPRFPGPHKIGLGQAWAGLGWAGPGLGLGPGGPLGGPGGPSGVDSSEGCHGLAICVEDIWIKVVRTWKPGNHILYYILILSYNIEMSMNPHCYLQFSWKIH